MNEFLPTNISRKITTFISNCPVNRLKQKNAQIISDGLRDRPNQGRSVISIRISHGWFAVDPTRRLVAVFLCSACSCFLVDVCRTCLFVRLRHRRRRRLLRALYGAGARCAAVFQCSGPMSRVSDCDTTASRRVSAVRNLPVPMM